MFDEGESPNHNQFAEAFEEASGFSKEGMTFFLAGMSYARKGGTLSEFKRIIARLLIEANLNDDAETGMLMSERTSHQVSPASSRAASGSGLPNSVQKHHAHRATPVREPSAADIASMENVRARVAGIIFDTFKMRDGRKIGDVRYGELLRLEGADRIEAEILKRIRERGTAAHDTPVRLLVKPKQLATIIRNAQRKYHAA